MTLPSLLMFIAVYAVAVATPGPGVVAIVARALGRGTAGIVPFLLGYVVGDLIWFIAAATGLSVLAKTYAPLFDALKYAGCAYLFYLAVQLWRQDPVLPDEASALPEQSGYANFMGSLFLTLGNPKVMIFFLSIMPLVIKPEEISVMIGLALALTISIVISSILFGYALLAARARRLFHSKSTIATVQKINAGVLAGAALVIASR